MSLGHLLSCIVHIVCGWAFYSATCANSGLVVSISGAWCGVGMLKAWSHHWAEGHVTAVSSEGNTKRIRVDKDKDKEKHKHKHVKVITRDTTKNMRKTVTRATK